jgi:hypothetical protein
MRGWTHWLVIAGLTLASCAPVAPATGVPPTVTERPASTATVAATATTAPPTATSEPSDTPLPELTETLAATTPPAAAVEGQLSEAGLFRAWYTSDIEPPPINEMHTWTLHVETADGALVEDASINVAGDMPAHGHGLPTQPQVTEYLGQGDYLVEGMQFSMGGFWVMTFEIEAAGQVDVVNFDLTLDE